MNIPFHIVALSLCIVLSSAVISGHARAWNIVPSVFCELFCNIEEVGGDLELTREQALEKMRILYEQYHALSPEEQEMYADEYNKQYLQFLSIVRGQTR